MGAETTPLSRNLEALVNSRHTTYEAVATVAGISKAAISQWKSGATKNANRGALSRIADYYQITIDDLISEGHGLHAKLNGGGLSGLSVNGCESGMAPVHSLGAVHAGDFDGQWELDGEAMLPRELLDRHPRCFALEVNGDCMDRVFTDRDHIFIDPDMEPRDGSIVVMSVDGDAVVRRIRMGNSSALLVADSHGRHDDIIIDSSARCLGVVFWWQSKGEVR